MDDHPKSDWISVQRVRDAAYIALASPDRILALCDDLDAAQRWIVSFPWVRDFACADCEAQRDPRASESDSLIPGFRCAWHTARAALEGKPADG